MFLYVITNHLNDKSYVGMTSKTVPKRWRQHLRRVAAGSKHAIHAAIAKHGEENFSICGVASFDTLEALAAAERELIASLGSFGPGGYNLTAGGEGTFGFRHTPEEVEARRQRRTGTKHTEEAKAKIRAAHAGKTLSPEHLAKLVAANTGRKMPEGFGLGRKMTPENIEKLRKRATGNKWSVGIKRTEAQKEHMRAMSTGRRHTDEAKAKIRTKRAEQAPTFGMMGKSHSDETKRKMSDAAKGRKKSPETIERMRAAAQRRIAQGRNGAVNPKTD